MKDFYQQKKSELKKSRLSSAFSMQYSKSRDDIEEEKSLDEKPEILLKIQKPTVKQL